MGLTPVDYITENLDGVLNDNQALVCCINSERTNGLGYLVGVATMNEKGYKPTSIVLKEHNYNVANEWVNEANHKIFKRDRKITAKIILSSMF